jgi:hypothetical protein
VELQFRDEDGPLDGLKLTGFAIWKGKTGRPVVTFPARTYTLAGRQRRFVLLRPAAHAKHFGEPEGRLRTLIVAAYERCVAKAA